MKQIHLQNEMQSDFRVAEAFKTLRANLQFCGIGKKVIMVTSCTQSDGKTTISYEIANSFAQDGRRVLLLDTDLRKSVMSLRLLGEEYRIGTTNVLSGTHTFEECVCHTQYPNLDVLFAGSIPPNPVELLGSQTFADLVEFSRQTYDVVIVDTPPLGAVIDAAVVGKVCDGAVLVICANTVSRHFATGVLDQLKKSGCPVLGSVLNRVTLHTSRFYKGYYYRYGKYYKRYYRYGYGRGEHGYGYSAYGQQETPKKKFSWFKK